MKQVKTNAMRAFEREGLAYETHTCPDAEGLTGLQHAQVMGQDPDRVFKTLVTEGRSGGHYVFVIPVGASLDLRKAAAAAGEKAVSIIPQKELLPLTGYVHGGCSPVGMKKAFPTFVDETACLFERILFSAGRIGCQIEADPEALRTLTGFTYADLTV